MLRIAAAAGRTVDHALLAAAADVSEADLNAALREAVEAYLLAPDSSIAGYSFRHALVREAIYSDLLAGERRALHLKLARAISQQSHPAGATSAVAAELAHHWYAAGELTAALPASVTPGPRLSTSTRPARRCCITNARSRSGTPSVLHRASSAFERVEVSAAGG